MEQFKSLDEFYDCAEILMTGATGFMGKILIEKLLRTFPRIKNIYIIVRDKKGQSPAQRIDTMFETSEIFQQLWEEMPHFKLKIKVLSGKLEAPDLGLRLEDRKLLTSKVNIVFHCAATVRFDEELRTAISVNVGVTQKMLDLAKQCSLLRMFTQVSTAFSNANRKGIIEEIIYNPHTHYTELLKISQLDLDDPMYQQSRKRLAKENVNTYTLTKAAAEQLLSEEAQLFPVSIFRPSVVVSTWKDPIPGWTDNLYGPTGLLTIIQAGVVRSILVDPHVKADIVPVDYAINALICAPWNGLLRFQKDNSSLPIYNYISSNNNSITWGEFSKKFYDTTVNVPASKTLWPCVFFLTKNKTVNYLRCLVLHYLFGYIFDLFSRLSGNDFRLIPIYKKFDKLVSALEPFSTREWEFDNSNVRAMWNSLTPEERARFPFNIEDLDWDDFIDKYTRGTLVYHLREKMDASTRRKAMRRYKRLTIAHHCIKGLMYVLLCVYLWTLLKHLS